MFHLFFTARENYTLSDLSVPAQSLGTIVICNNIVQIKKLYIIYIVGVWLLSGKMSHSQSREPGFESPKVAAVSKVGHFRSIYNAPVH